MDFLGFWLGYHHLMLASDGEFGCEVLVGYSHQVLIAKFNTCGLPAYLLAVFSFYIGAFLHCFFEYILLWL